jgi:hypothetical protein
MITLVLFGEAEKGNFRTPFFINSLFQLADTLGNPPQDSQGLLFAIQALLYRRNIVFFRVEHEGFSNDDYLAGFHLLKTKKISPKPDALCLPGVGDKTLLDAVDPLCKIYKSFLIVTEKDLYDYLTSKN